MSSEDLAGREQSSPFFVPAPLIASGRSREDSFMLAKFLARFKLSKTQSIPSEDKIWVVIPVK